MVPPKKKSGKPSFDERGKKGKAPVHNTIKKKKKKKAARPEKRHKTPIFAPILGGREVKRRKEERLRKSGRPKSLIARVRTIKGRKEPQLAQKCNRAKKKPVRDRKEKKCWGRHQVTHEGNQREREL